MKKNLFYLFFLSFTLVCCKQTIPKEKISIIENLTLGVSKDSFFNQIKSKNIPFESFIMSYLVLDRSQLIGERNFITMYYTNLFNSFANQSQEHVGLLYPITLSGTDNIFGMVILLGHTKKPVLLGSAKEYEYMNTSKCIKQTVNERLIEQIKEMYTSKYGPAKESSSTFNSVYDINNGKIEDKLSNEKEAKTINWENDYMTITFFTGLKNYSSGYYRPRDKFYLDINMENDTEDILNKVDCYTYAYIKYQLKQKAIDELKLKNSKF